MNRTIAAIALISVGFSGLGMTEAVATEAKPPASKTPAPSTNVAKVPSRCEQLGTGYQDLYTFEADTQTITICQKGPQYVYVETPKAHARKN